MNRLKIEISIRGNSDITLIAISGYASERSLTISSNFLWYEKSQSILSLYVAMYLYLDSLSSK